MEPFADDLTFSETILRRFRQLRSDAGRAGREDLLEQTLEELATAAEELRVTEEAVRRHQLFAADAWMAAERSDTWHNAILAAGADAVLVTDRAGRIRDLNPAAAALLGVRAEVLRTKPLAAYVPEADRRAFRTRLAALPSGGRAERFELCLAPRGAEPLWVDAAVAPFLAAEGEEGLHWSLREVTARRAGEAARDEALQTLRRALDAAGEALAVLDVDGTVVHWNRAAERLLGWTEEDVAGRPLPAGAADGAALPAVLAFRTPGGEKIVAVRREPLEDDAGSPRGALLVLSPPAAQGAGRPSAWPDHELVRAVESAPGGDLTERLRSAVAAGVYLGLLAPGDRLPSIRRLAAGLGVDHRQVSAAYRRLEREGTVEVRSRYGAVVAERAPACAPPELESAAWVARVAAEGAALQLKVPHIADLVRRWTGGGTVRCLCVEGTEDGRAALAGEMESRWGFRAEAAPAPLPGERGALAAALAGADVVATTPFHAAAVDAPARAAGVPVVVLAADREAVDALTAALAEGEAAAVVADAAYGERLRALPGGERLRVVDASDEAAIAALDEAQPVLLTRAAQQRIRRPLRLLAPVSSAFSAACAAELAAVLVARNLRAERSAR